jgi:hypothetical protein
MSEIAPLSQPLAMPGRPTGVLEVSPLPAAQMPNNPFVPTAPVPLPSSVNLVIDSPWGPREPSLVRVMPVDTMEVYAPHGSKPTLAAVAKPFVLGMILGVILGAAAASLLSKSAPPLEPPAQVVQGPAVKSAQPTPTPVVATTAPKELAPSAAVAPAPVEPSISDAKKIHAYLSQARKAVRVRQWRKAYLLSTKVLAIQPDNEAAAKIRAAARAKGGS